MCSSITFCGEFMAVRKPETETLGHTSHTNTLHVTTFYTCFVCLLFISAKEKVNIKNNAKLIKATAPTKKHKMNSEAKHSRFWWMLQEYAFLKCTDLHKLCKYCVMDLVHIQGKSLGSPIKQPEKNWLCATTISLFGWSL